MLHMVAVHSSSTSLNGVSCAEERNPVSYKLKKGELDAPDTPAGSPERELGGEAGSEDGSDEPVRQDASEGDSEAELAPDATNGKAGTQVSHLSRAQPGKQ